jgi:hypothetical protein
MKKIIAIFFQNSSHTQCVDLKNLVLHLEVEKQNAFDVLKKKRQCTSIGTSKVEPTI